MMIQEGRASRLITGIAIAGASALLAFLALRGVLRETAGVNSYGALADAFLNGRLWVERCPEIDCAVWNGRTYIIFPPFPALLAMPFVAAFGFGGFKFFILLSAAISLLSLWVWRSILDKLDVARELVPWFLAAIAFGSPLYQVIVRSDGVWFFAQSVGFLMMSLSIWAVVVRRSLALAGLFVALAFLCRQMAIFYPLFLFFLARPQDSGLADHTRAQLRSVLLAAVPVAAALAMIFWYNHARFGSFTDTGYAYISNPGPRTVIAARIADIGLFSKDYVLFNVLHLFVQGAHFEFAQPFLTKLSGFDKMGVALPVASPWLILALSLRRDLVTGAGIATILIIAGFTLFYHSNGAEQINASRYALDWLPILLVLMAQASRQSAYAALPHLVTWAILTNACITALVAFYRL